jgi:hypothetical protein
MPEFQRDKSGAVVIRYTEKELEDHLGYRLLKLEKRVEELERLLKEVVGFVLYLRRETKGEKVD